MYQATHLPSCSSHRSRSRFRWLLALSASALLLTALQGCFTGIESTPRISESDLRKGPSRDMRPELTYLDGIAGQPPASWAAGKKWTVTDPRSERVFGINLDGAVISLAEISEAPSITGLPVAILSFDSPAGRVSYRTDISADSLMHRKDFSIPYSVENTLVDEVSRRLKGNTYYVNTSLWNDDAGNSLRGLKYIPVEVMEVEPGRGIYPIGLLLSYTIPQKGISATPGLVSKTDATRRFFTLAMAAPGHEAGTTHSFADLFSLSDPRKRYPKISDEAWANIKAGKVSQGMTRDECRLALGAPDEINRHPGYSEMREIWTYSEGIRLVFADGILTSAYR